MYQASYHKVKFQDQQLDDYILENSVLKSKLQSKVDALSIINKELDKCSMERDKYKVLVEQLQYKNIAPIKRQDNDNTIYRFTPTNTISCSDILAKTRDQNDMLKLEVEMLRSHLEEATGDIIVLRNQLQNKQSRELSTENKNFSKFTYSNKDYEQLVQDLEKIKKKYQQIQLDYRATLDEKEELVSDREYYKSKVQRLNHQISFILTNRGKAIQMDDNKDLPKPIVDIDALVNENKYLHERISQLQIEKEIIKQTLSKYKALLDNRNKNYPAQFNKGFTDVMTQKQVRDFLDIDMKMGSKQKISAVELKSLSLGLFEALNDKSIALQHQRKTNQILANRITELERTLESWCNGEKYIPIFPSQMLIDEFLTEELKDKNPNEPRDIVDNDTCKNYDSDEENNDYFNKNRNESKIILPRELEELVKEALAELKLVE